MLPGVCYPEILVEFLLPEFDKLVKILIRELHEMQRSPESLMRIGGRSCLL